MDKLNKEKLVKLANMLLALAEEIELDETPKGPTFSDCFTAIMRLDTNKYWKEELTDAVRIGKPTEYYKAVLEVLDSSNTSMWKEDMIKKLNSMFA